MLDFDNNKFFPKEQAIKIDVTKLELGKEHTIYIKCEGRCGQSHDPGYDWNFLRFTFEEKPDELAPYIVEVIPDPFRQSISSESTEETIIKPETTKIIAPNVIVKKIAFAMLLTTLNIISAAIIKIINVIHPTAILTFFLFILS